jgi:hypothetical protein
MFFFFHPFMAVTALKYPALDRIWLNPVRNRREIRRRGEQVFFSLPRTLPPAASWH